MGRKSRKISRRDFVGRAGLGAATLAGAGAIGGVELEAQQNTAGAVPTTWDFEADVVVIGSGACGLPAAIRAADHGASAAVGVGCGLDSPTASWSVPDSVG